MNRFRLKEVSTLTNRCVRSIWRKTCTQYTNGNKPLMINTNWTRQNIYVHCVHGLQCRTTIMQQCGAENKKHVPFYPYPWKYIYPHTSLLSKQIHEEYLTLNTSTQTPTSLLYTTLHNHTYCQLHLIYLVVILFTGGDFFTDTPNTSTESKYASDEDLMKWPSTITLLTTTWNICQTQFIQYFLSANIAYF